MTGLDGIADGEESSCAGIDKHHALLLIDGDDTFDHGIENGGEEINRGGGFFSGEFEAEDTILELVFELVECAGDVADFVVAIGDIEEHVIAVVTLYGALEFSGHDLERADDAGSDDEEAEGAE